MKYLATLLLLAATSTASAQVTVGTSEIQSTVRSVVAHSDRPTSGGIVLPLSARLAFAVDIQSPTVVFRPDYQDHEMTVNVTNLMDTVINMQFYRHQGKLGNWVTSICYGVSCFSSKVDSGPNTFAMPPKSTSALLVHFNDTSSFQVPVNDTIRISILLRQEPGLSTDTLNLHFTQITDPNFSGVSAGRRPEQSASIMSIFPNPAFPHTNSITAQVYSAKQGVGTVSIYDIDGKKLREITLDHAFQVGTNVLQFDPSGLTSGTYILGIAITGAPKLLERFEIVR